MESIETGRRTRTRGLVALGLFLLCALTASRARAVEIGPEGELGTIELHGFVSQGFILTLRNDYLIDDSTNGSFEFSEVGINFTTTLTDTLRVGIQLFAQDLGPSGNYSPEVDWFYLDYQFQDWLGFRAGRMKIPYGLYNEIQDADSARVPVLLPQSVYPLQTREILFAHTGVQLYGFARLGALGALDYRIFGGTIFLDPDDLTQPGSMVDIDLRVPYVVGGRLIWETPIEGLRIAGSVEAVRLETTAFIPETDAVLIENDSLLWVGSAEYALGGLTVTAEYSRWSADQSSSDDAISPPIEVQSERAYAMATYGVTDWLQPGAYYALFFPDVDRRAGRENQQHDLAVTLRFDINPYWLVKLEGHSMIGTAGLLNPLRVGDPDLSMAHRHWGALFLKTTAYF